MTLQYISYSAKCNTTTLCAAAVLPCGGVKSAKLFDSASSSKVSVKQGVLFLIQAGGVVTPLQPRICYALYNNAVLALGSIAVTSYLSQAFSGRDSR